MGELFGTDGIRGEANRYPMDAMTAFSVGQAVSHLLSKNKARPRVVLGRDTRLSGPMIQSALVAGIISMGGDPCLAGVLPTPGIAFITSRQGADAGIVISASHNPYQDNGIKVFSGSGFKLTDAQEEEIERLVLGNRLPEMVPHSSKLGRPFDLDEAAAQYIAFLRDTFPRDLSMAGMKIVLDTANGATFKVAPETLSQLGADVEVIHDQPDGLNINEGCGSQYTRDLEGRVLASGASLGLAFDGDGDRLIAVDEKGNKLTGDQILIICARALKEQGRLKNNLVVSTVMSNLGLRIACQKLGFRYQASRVGDRYVLEDMLKGGAVVGGEDSGHMIFLDHHTTGDGIIASLQLISAMIRQNRPLSELAAIMDVFPQRLMNVDVKKKPAIETVPEIVEAIKQVESELGDQGRVLVRYSGTQSMCRVMVEAPSDNLADTYCRQIADAVQSALC